MRPRLPYRKAVILCIEDNEDYLRLRRGVLEKNGYVVLSAVSAAAACKQLRHSLVSLVISDHMLGDTTGTELAKKIRQIQPRVPILLYSGTMPEHLGDVNCFLSKAEPVESFLKIIGSLVNRYQEQAKGSARSEDQACGIGKMEPTLG